MAFEKNHGMFAGGEAQEAPVSRIAAAIIHQAIRENVSSICLVPNETEMRVEYQREGIWTETMLLPKRLEPEITTHLMEMAGLPTQYRMALEGLILVRTAPDLPPGDREYAAPIPTATPQPGEQDYDVHLLVTPTRYGEKMTLNIEAVKAVFPD